MWISEIDAKKAGIIDNDWIEAFNTNGALVARAVVSQRVKQGMCMMYHAQEKIVNVPGSEITGQRGGIHNSVTRTVLKPTHMIGGYVQQSYGFNYYGTVGSNRDEFVIVRKMAKVDWLDRPTTDQPKLLSIAPKIEAAEHVIRVPSSYQRVPACPRTELGFRTVSSPLCTTPPCVPCRRISNEGCEGRLSAYVLAGEFRFGWTILRYISSEVLTRSTLQECRTRQQQAPPRAWL